MNGPKKNAIVKRVIKEKSKQDLDMSKEMNVYDRLYNAGRSKGKYTTQKLYGKIT